MVPFSVSSSSLIRVGGSLLTRKVFRCACSRASVSCEKLHWQFLCFFLSFQSPRKPGCEEDGRCRWLRFSADENLLLPLALRWSHRPLGFCPSIARLPGFLIRMSHRESRLNHLFLFLAPLCSLKKGGASTKSDATCVDVGMLVVAAIEAVLRK